MGNDRPEDHYPATRLPPTAAQTVARSGTRPGGAAGGVEQPPAGSARYEVTGELARGGMGVVYQARDLRFGREVAVKLVQDRFRGDRGVVRRFVAEAKFTARLQHPGIPPVHDLGEFPDGSPFLAMKLVSGDTLAAALASRPDPAGDRPRLLAVFEQVCQAVGYAHGQGVIHRDLKPANVMVGAFGEVQVMDWGLAKDIRAGGGEPSPEADPAPPPDATDPDLTTVPSNTPRPFDHHADSDATVAGSVLGTPAYMAPEQARGETARVGPRADVFGLGGVLCEILTGHPPFGGAGARDSLTRAATADLTDALGRLAGSGADAELVALCRSCLAPDPADRPADGGAVAAAVAEYRAGVDRRLREAETEAARAGEQRKRVRVQVALAAAVGLLVLGGAAAAWWHDKVTTEEAHRRQDEANKVVADKLREEVEAANRAWLAQEERAKKAQVLETNLARCEAALTAGDTRRAATHYALLEGQAGDATGADQPARLAKCSEEIALLVELDRIDALRWTVDRDTLQKAAARALTAEAFARFDITPEPTSLAAAAGRVAGALARARLVAELHWWMAEEAGDGTRANLVRLLAAVDPDPFRDEARGHLAGRNWGAVEELLTRQSFKDQPDWFVSAFVSAVGSQAGVAAETREAALKEAVVRTPDDFATLMTLGRLVPPGQARETAAARARCCQAALALRPKNAAACHNLGIALRDLGDTAGALAAFDAAVAADRGYTAAHVNRGITLLTRNDPAGATAAYERAILLPGGSSNAHNNLGVLQYDRGDVAGAEREFRAAIGLNKQFAAARVNLGNVLWHRGNEDAAIREWKEAVRLDDKYALARFKLAAAWESENNLDRAVTGYQAAIDADGSFVQAHYALGAVWLKKRCPDAAAAAFREAIRIDPKHALSHAELGRLRLQAKEWDGAIEYFEIALKLRDEFNLHAEVHPLLAQARGGKAGRDRTKPPGGCSAAD